MAGDWIKMRSDLHTHPKVVRMASASNADRLRVIGGLHAVWCLFDVHSEDGSLSGYTPQAVDDLIGFPGFAEVMAGVSWLEIHSDGLVLPEFNEHNGQSAKRRATEAKRKRQERENPSQNTVRKMSASDADKKRTREEKRREEDKPPTVVKRASRKCPPDFEVTEDMRTWAALECPTVNVSKATAKFCDHTFKTAMTDWNGAWRNWLRKDAEYGPAKPGGQSEPAWRTEQRERTQKAAPGVAVGGATQFFTDLEAKDVTPLILG